MGQKTKTVVAKWDKKGKLVLIPTDDKGVKKAQDLISISAHELDMSLKHKTSDLYFSAYLKTAGVRFLGTEREGSKVCSSCLRKRQ